MAYREAYREDEEVMVHPCAAVVVSLRVIAHHFIALDIQPLYHSHHTETRQIVRVLPSRSTCVAGEGVCAVANPRRRLRGGDLMRCYRAAVLLDHWRTCIDTIIRVCVRCVMSSKPAVECNACCRPE